MLMRAFLLASELYSDDTHAAVKPKGESLFRPDTLWVFAAVLVISAVLFFWAFFIRKRANVSRHGGVVLVRRSGSGQRDAGERYGASGRRRRRKRRADHPDNLPRNPTLAEAGGLPPVRPEEPEPPAAPDGTGQPR